ncbi:MFS transporter [Micromonospora sp. WMMA1998]|uniref:MFS transporter n=1 Tax=unclassified Micromonospora TaxID=2617518 RepID=UPI00248AC329|nr:MFS transporter [Micromonospora sp. WMMA1998]WBC16738.1 MFS transporter [Micromonospora sp. WMMA1998]
MRDYINALRIRDYRLLWIGSVVNLLGDGASWTALTWMAITQGGAKAVGVMAVCYTLPVILGGALVGPLLDRFSRRTLLVADAFARAAIIGAVPLLDATGALHLWYLYVVAGAYGLLKIVPLGVVPAVTPELVPKKDLHSAVALEGIAYGAAGMAGPALGGLLIAAFGAPVVLGLDALSYVFFAFSVLAMRARLPRPEGETSVSLRQSFGWAPVIRMLRNDTVLVTITAAFALFNMTVGMLRVTIPWMAITPLAGDARTLGLLLAVGEGAGLAGSLISGMIKPADRQMRRIGLLQLAAGGGLIFLLLPGLPAALLGLILVNLFSTPMTVSAQVLRLNRIPAEVRGRTMTFMRTLMNATSPGGAAIAGPLLAASLFAPTVILMVAIAALPGLYMAVRFRSTSYGEELGVTPKRKEPAAQPS